MMRWQVFSILILPVLFGIMFGSFSVVNAENMTEYRQFLAAKAIDPVEYMLSLFEKHKVVVFCENLHPEMTQYEFLSKLLRHPKFAKRVKAVFTEIGSRSQQGVMDQFLRTTPMDVQKLIRINQENIYHPSGWSNRNIFLFWQNLWKMNAKKPDNEKVWAYLSDIAWEWDAIKTSADYEKAANSPEMKERDLWMAKLIATQINTLEAQPASNDSRNSYLVVMNTRHALGNVIYQQGGRPGENVGRFLKDAFGNDQVHCVLYHSKRAYAPGGNSEMHLIANGKWDAAFALNQNRPVGFDLKESPFGNEAFDYHIVFYAPNYAGAFDGLVFFKPLTEHYSMSFFEGFYDKNFLKTLEKRCILAKRDNVIQGIIEQAGYESFMNDYPKMKNRVVKKEEFKQKIAPWLDQ